MKKIHITKQLSIQKIKGNHQNCYIILIICFLTLTSSLSCKKAVQVDPPDSGLVSTTVYSSNTTAAAVLTSIYDRMMSSSGGLSGGNASISLYTGLSSDELKNYSTNVTLSQLYTNSLTNKTSTFWTELYQEIYVTNAAIEGLNASKSLSTGIKQQLLGEAKFMRAFLHFYATNLFGDVPLVTSTDYRVNNIISRTPKVQVYQQIIADLKDAQDLLSDNYLTSTGAVTTDRIRPNKGAATALLARVYLYTGDWADAIKQSSLLINNSATYGLVSDPNSVFLKTNNTEAILQFQPVVSGNNTFDAQYFVLTSKPGTGKFLAALSTDLVNSFEPGDNRFNDWVGQFTSGTQTYYYPYKYKVYLQNQPVTEYLMVLRLAEQYLIRAEANAQPGPGGNLSQAINDLNVIRKRAGLSNTTATTQADVLAAIYHEEQIEFFSEWGHRWFDLKRTGNVNSTMGSPGNVCADKGGIWSPNWTLYPIPQSEILVNPHLTQNPGYN